MKDYRDGAYSSCVLGCFWRDLALWDGESSQEIVVQLDTLIFGREGVNREFIIETGRDVFIVQCVFLTIDLIARWFDQSNHRRSML